MAGGASTGLAGGLPAQTGMNLNNPQGTPQTQAGKGPGTPGYDVGAQMKTQDGKNFNDAAGKSPGQPQVQPTINPMATNTTTMGTQVLPAPSNVPSYAQPYLSAFKPPPGMLPQGSGSSPYANMFAESQNMLNGTAGPGASAPFIGAPGPGPGGQSISPLGQAALLASQGGGMPLPGGPSGMPASGNPTGPQVLPAPTNPNSTPSAPGQGTLSGARGSDHPLQQFDMRREEMDYGRGDHPLQQLNRSMRGNDRNEMQRRGMPPIKPGATNVGLGALQQQRPGVPLTPEQIKMRQ